MSNPDALERLAQIIQSSGLSRRQFARRVMGRAESVVQRWFDIGEVPNAAARAWIRSIERVQLEGDRVLVELRVYAPVRKTAATSRPRGVTPKVGRPKKSS